MPHINTSIIHTLTHSHHTHTHTTHRTKQTQTQAHRLTSYNHHTEGTHRYPGIRNVLSFPTSKNSREWKTYNFSGRKVMSLLVLVFDAIKFGY